MEQKKIWEHSSIFKNLNKKQNEEFVQCLFSQNIQNTELKIEHIFSEGESSELYDQEENEWLILMQGKAKIGLYEEKQNQIKLKKIITLEEGDTLFIPKHLKHKVLYTSKTPPCHWLCIFF